jgi:hypothetical protein
MWVVNFSYESLVYQALLTELANHFTLTYYVGILVIIVNDGFYASPQDISITLGNTQQLILI